MPKKVQRGEIYWCDLGEAVGSEQGGCRPVIIVQNDIGNTYSTTTIVVPLTTKIKKTTLPTHYEFINNGVKQVACAEQIRTVDKLRLGTNLGLVRKEDVAAISRCVQIAVEEIKFKPKCPRPRRGKEELSKEDLETEENLEETEAVWEKEPSLPQGEPSVPGKMPASQQKEKKHVKSTATSPRRQEPSPSKGKSSPKPPPQKKPEGHTTFGKGNSANWDKKEGGASYSKKNQGGSVQGKQYGGTHSKRKPKGKQQAESQ